MATVNTGANYFNTRESQEGMRSILRHNPLTIRFMKVDGSERVMNCSLESARFPEFDLPVPKENDDPFAEDKAWSRASKVLTVIDTDSLTWKSIRWNSILSFASVE